MKDIVKEAQEELERNAEDFWGIKQFHLGGTHREIVVGLLGRIQELEQERDAALEQVRELEDELEDLRAFKSAVDWSRNV